MNKLIPHSFVRRNAVRIVALVAALMINVIFLGAIFHGGQSEMYRILVEPMSADSERRK